jgi:hypothetical protein
MKINDINLDDFDKKEYLAFVQALLDYYYVQFNEALAIIVQGE